MLTDTGENASEKKRRKYSRPLLDVFACWQVSSPRLYRLKFKKIFKQPRVPVILLTFLNSQAVRIDSLADIGLTSPFRQPRQYLTPTAWELKLVARGRQSNPNPDPTFKKISSDPGSNPKNFQIQSQSLSFQNSIPIPKFEPDPSQSQEILGIALPK